MSEYVDFVFYVTIIVFKKELTELGKVDEDTCKLYALFIINC